MGWREFNAWLGVMREQIERKSDVGSWAGADNDPRWVEMRRERDLMMGRR